LRAAAPPPPTRSRCPHHVRLQAVAPALAPVAKEVSNTPKRGRNTRRACQTSSSWLCSCKMTLRRKCSSGVCFSPTSLATALRSGTALRERSTRHKTRAVSRRRCTTMLARSNHAPACKLAVRALQLARDGVPADVRAAAGRASCAPAAAGVSARNGLQPRECTRLQHRKPAALHEARGQSAGVHRSRQRSPNGCGDCAGRGRVSRAIGACTSAHTASLLRRQHARRCSGVRACAKGGGGGVHAA